MASRSAAPVTIPATTAHRKFGEIVRRAFSGEHFIVEKDGLPVVAVISAAEYRELVEARERGRRVSRFRQLARDIGQEAEKRGLTEEQVMAELEVTRRQVYQERYGDE